MPRSGWGLIAAIGVGLTVSAYGAGILVGSGNQQSQSLQTVGSQTSARQHGNQPQQAATDRAGLPSLVERAISNPEPKDGEDNEKRDLAAQEATATFTFWMVVIALGQTVVAAIGIYYIRKSLIAANQSHFAETRAWLVIKNVKIKRLSLFEIPDEEPSIWIEPEYEIENVGHAPALNVAIAERAESPHFGGVETFFEGAAKLVGNQAIAPQQVMPRPLGMSVAADLPEYDGDPRFRSGSVQIAISITYRSVGDPKVRQTTASYMIGRYQGGLRVFNVEEIRQEIENPDIQPVSIARMT